MSDPFEAASAPFPTSTPTLREPSVQQAVTFLNDPRVKNADATAALDFLRKKGITEEELREAYRRCGLPFPSTVHTASVPQPPPPHPPASYTHLPPHLVPLHPPLPPPPPPPPQRGPSWVSVFFGVAAAAGLYTAFREVLKRYVVPMYFPEAARIAEETRRQDEFATRAQDLQIAQLRQQVKQLTETCRKTDETVDQLAASMRSMLDGECGAQWRGLTGGGEAGGGEFSQSSELRNAIRPLSHSVSASGGTSTSRVASDAVVDGASDDGFRRLLGDKRGSVSYGHVEEFRGVKVEGGLESGIAGTRVVVKGGEEVDGGKSGEGEGGGSESEDEFMCIKPAEVEESWGVGLVKVEEEREGGRAGGEGGDGEGERSDRAGGVERGEEEAGSSVEVESVTREELRIEGAGGREDESFGGTVTQAARQLFQTELMNEAKYVFGRVPQGFGGESEIGRNADRGRPVSMPAMEAPLSDNE